MTSAQIAVKAAGWSIIRILKLGLFSLFLFFIIISTIITAVNTGSIIPAIKDLGGRFLFITDNIKELSNKIIENEGIYIRKSNIFKSIGSYLWALWDLFTNLYILYLWIKIFTKLYGWSPISNDSAKFANLCLAIVTFLILQMLFILIFIEPTIGQSRFEQMYIPFTAFYDLFRAIPYLIPDFTRLTNSVSPNINGNKDITPIITSNKSIIVI